ncbi:MAG: prolipoprotein diacylglyceryl transferase [Clostridia bacterium]|nr:prolipoprotein diacylglyceryl transferase [Clostridia bacterium]
MISLFNSIKVLAEKGYVEFPNLFKNHGIKLNINDVAFKIGSFEVRWYGLLISGVVILCIFLGMRSCKKYNIEPNDLLDYLLFSLPAAIIGLRVYYVVFNFSQYKDNLVSIFYFWEGGLAIYGGIIGAFIAVFIISKVKKQKMLHIVDFLIGYIALGQAVGRWGNFFNQEAFGGPTTLPWGMTGDKIALFVRSQGWDIGTLVHPTFLYESLWCLIIFVTIMLYRRSKHYKSDGECLAIYMIMYGFERMLVEGLRTDSLYIGNTGIRVSQLLSGILLIVGIALFIDLKVRYRKGVYEGTISVDVPEDSGFKKAMAIMDDESGLSGYDGAGTPEEVAEAAENAKEAASEAAANAREAAEKDVAEAGKTAEEAAAEAGKTAAEAAEAVKDIAEQADKAE